MDKDWEDVLFFLEVDSMKWIIIIEIRRLRMRIIYLLTAFLFFVCEVPAVEVDLKVKSNVKVSSAYLWRGQILNDEAVIQPSVTMQAENFSLKVWGTWDLTDVEGSSERTRADVELDYSVVQTKQLFNMGAIAYIYYDTPGSKDTFEVLFDYALLVPLMPSFTVYYDFGEINGFYGKIGVAHSFELLENKLFLDINASVGGADEEYADKVFSISADEENGIEAYVPEKSALLDFTAKASLPVKVREKMRLIPEIKYMTLLDSEIRDAMADAGFDNDEMAVSITLLVEF
jgi:hypothetical protein